MNLKVSYFAKTVWRDYLITAYSSYMRSLNFAIKKATRPKSCLMKSEKFSLTGRSISLKLSVLTD